MNVAIDVETTKKPFIYPWQEEAELVCVSTCADNNERRTWFFEHPEATQTPLDNIREINEYLSNFNRVIAHNMMFDCLWLNEIGIDLSKHNLYCTMVAEYLIRGHQKQEGLSLDDLGREYNIPLKKDKVKLYWDAGKDTHDIPARLLQPYCEQDCVNALAIFRRQMDRLKLLKLMMLFSLEMQALPAYAEMERNGMRLDIPLLEKYRDEYQAKLDDLDKQLCQKLGIHNVGSNQQLSAGLFGGTYNHEYKAPMLGDDGEPIRFKSGQKEGEIRYQKVVEEIHVEGLGVNPKKCGIAETAIDGVYETNIDALKRIQVPKAKREVLDLLFERSRMSQILGTYFVGLLKIRIGEYVYPTINQALTKTGRTSCARPNLQNQPRGNTGPVKECFITRY